MGGIDILMEENLLMFAERQSHKARYGPNVIVLEAKQFLKPLYWFQHRNRERQFSNH